MCTFSLAFTLVVTVSTRFPDKRAAAGGPSPESGIVSDQLLASAFLVTWCRIARRRVWSASTVDNRLRSAASPRFVLSQCLQPAGRPRRRCGPYLFRHRVRPINTDHITPTELPPSTLITSITFLFTSLSTSGLFKSQLWIWEAL